VCGLEKFSATFLSLILLHSPAHLGVVSEKLSGPSDLESGPFKSDLDSNKINSFRTFCDRNFSQSCREIAKKKSIHDNNTNQYGPDCIQ
jgi:hypothetical protein